MSKSILKLTLKHCWFDSMLTGFKPYEYREVKDSWIRRFVEEMPDPDNPETWKLKRFDAVHYFRGGHFGKQLPHMHRVFDGIMVYRHDYRNKTAPFFPQNDEPLEHGRWYFVIVNGDIVEKHGCDDIDIHLGFAVRDTYDNRGVIIWTDTSIHAKEIAGRLYYFDDSEDDNLESRRYHAADCMYYGKQVADWDTKAGQRVYWKLGWALDEGSCCEECGDNWHYDLVPQSHLNDDGLCKWCEKELKAEAAK